MTLLALLKGDLVALAKGKVIKAEQYTQLVLAEEIVKIAQEEAEQKKLRVTNECKKLKSEAKKEGFAQGLKEWSEKLAELESMIVSNKKEMEQTLVPLAIAAVKKIIGKEIELRSEAVVDIVASSLKAVAHHRRITLFVNKNDYELFERGKGALKAAFQNLQSFALSARDDVAVGTCIVETEGGIISVDLEEQLKALEGAFHAFIEGHKSEGGAS